MPTPGHQVGPFFISREGVVEMDENEPTVDAAIDGVVMAGFTGNIEAGPEQENGKDEMSGIPSGLRRME